MGTEATAAPAAQPRGHGTAAQRCAQRTTQAMVKGGRERERAAQQHHSGDSGNGTERYSVAAVEAVNQAGAGQCHDAGDQAGQAWQRACARRARQRGDGVPPRPGDRASPKGLAQERVVHRIKVATTSKPLPLNRNRLHHDQTNT